MSARGKILLEHYLQLIRRAGVWLGIGSLLATMVATTPALALGVQMGARSATLSTAGAGATPVSVAFSFKPGTASSTIKSIRFQLCTSPLESTACTSPAGATMNPSTISAQSFGNAYITPTYISTTDMWVTNATGNVLVSGTPYTATLATVHNPPATNTSFYFRITTYTDVAVTTEQDFGAMAVSTADVVTTTANVQESLTFCVYTATCGAGVVNPTKLGTGVDNILNASTATGAISKMDASTNASSGYVITYMAGSLASSGDTITDAGGAATTFTAGTSKFGINLKANSTALTPAGALGAANTGSGVVIAPYATVDQIAFVSGAPQTVANTGGVPQASSTYTVTYAAQAGNTTKPGAFTTTFNWICTGSF